VLVDETDKDWQQSCLRIIEFYSRLWGGAYNLIVPTDGNDIDERFWTILEAFDPDHLISYGKSGRDFFLNHPDQYEAQLNAEIASFMAQAPDSDVQWARGEIDRQFKDSRISEFQISEKLQTQLRLRLCPFWFENWTVEGPISAGSEPDYPLTDLVKIILSTEHPDRFAVIDVPGEEVPKLWFTAATGSFTLETAKALEELGILEDKYVLSDNLSGLIELTVTGGIRKPRVVRDVSDALFRLDGILPYQLSMLQLGLYRSSKYAGYAEPLILVAGNTLQDFCLYYCLSRMRDRVVWMLPSLTEKAIAGTSGQATRAERSFMYELNSGGYSPRSQGGFAATTYSLTEPQLEAVTANLKLPGFRNLQAPIKQTPPIDDLLRVPLVAYERDNLQRDIPVQLSNEVSLSPFPTPKPKNFSKIHPYEHRYITQLTIAKETPPKHFDLGHRIIPDHRYSTKDTRIGRDGPAYFCPSVAWFGGDIDTALVRPHLRLPPLHKIVEELAGKDGYQVRPSDKGIYADESIAKWGGLESACNFLRDKMSRALLDRFLDVTGSSPGKGVYLSDDRRRYLDFEAIKAQVGNRATSVIDELIGRQILYRGFIFLCLYCRSSSWFSVSDIGQEFKCKRCGRTQVYTKANWKTPDEPSWFYKLDEIVFQGYRNGMVVPLLALDYLRSKSIDAFSFTTDREIWKSRSSGPDAEADFFCAPDGALTIGEAKKENRLGKSPSSENAEIKKYVHLVQLFSARQLVFATLSESWSDRTIQHVRHAFNGLPYVRLIFLAAAQLLDLKP
jgi:hypothetical protein